MSTDVRGASPKKKGIAGHRFIAILFEMTLAIGAAMWFIYGYLPQYYLPLSFLLLVIGGIVAYVILSKTVDF